MGGLGPTVTSSEELIERIDVAFVGTNMNEIELQTFEKCVKRLYALGGVFRDTPSHSLAAGIKHDRLPGLRIRKLYQAESW